jgi:hypothetical protein
MTQSADFRAGGQMAPWWPLFHDTREGAEECSECGVGPDNRQVAANEQFGGAR